MVKILEQFILQEYRNGPTRFIDNTVYIISLSKQHFVLPINLGLPARSLQETSGTATDTHPVFTIIFSCYKS